MINGKSAWINKIKKYVEASLYQEAITYFFSNLNNIYSTPNLRGIYEVVQTIPLEYFETLAQKFVLGYLCSIHDNKIKLNRLLNSISSEDLKHETGKSYYLALKSMELIVAEPEKSLYLAKIAITKLYQENKRELEANIYLNYATQLENLELYSMAAEYYREAAQIFEANNCDFFAINCFVKELLNYYALGKHDTVIELGSDMLKRCLPKSNYLNHWNLLKLPMALGYYAKNKRVLALRLLGEVEKTIKSLQIPQLYGILELYQYKLYFVEKKEREVEELLKSLELIFNYLDLKVIEQLIAVIKIEKSLQENKEIPKEWVKVIKLAATSSKNVPCFIVEAILKLRLAGKALHVPRVFIDSYFKKTKEGGHQVNTQSLALYLAELHYHKAELTRARYYVQIAYDIYRHTETSINFYNREISFHELIKELDPQLAQLIE